MKKYEIFNVNCTHCVNKIKNALKEEFGEISFSENLKTICVNIDDEEKLKDELEELGFKLGKEIL